MIRVVLDTNVVVSAMLRSGGLPEAVFNRAMAREIQLYLSDAILAEYEEVLHRPRLNIPPEMIDSALVKIREAATMIHPAEPVTAASDPDDNIFLECAQAAQAHYLVTGNTRHSLRHGCVRASCRHATFLTKWLPCRMIRRNHSVDLRGLLVCHGPSIYFSGLLSFGRR